ncbi:GNAT family N-acetyltransferase [Flavihumibacter sp. R14]|nr:GNAT family N-acetyltransferase [Flavihumibacter soli]
MITFVGTDAVLPLRSRVLRDGKPFQECVFPGDELETTFHLADIQNNEAVCVATFHLHAHPAFKGDAYQLRGMATAPESRGNGIGNQLLNFAIVYLRGLKTDYVWCNARKAAYSFYLGVGFEFISEEFEIAGIGPHRAMYLKIRH